MSTFELELPECIVAHHVVLRAWDERHADDFVAATLESVETVGRYMTWAHDRYAREDAERWIAYAREARAQRDAFEYAIEARDGRLLGGCGLNHVNRIHRLANLGYWVRASAQRRGHARDAARALATAGLVDGGLVRIEVVAHLDNRPSRRVAEGAGARFEGVLRSRIFHGERAHDAAGYSIVRDDLA